MKGIRFTGAELAWLKLVVDAAPAGKLKDAVVRKFHAAEAPAGPAIAPIEEVLVRLSRGKVVRLNNTQGYAKAGRMAALAGANLDDAETIGLWLGRQAWMRGVTTVITVMQHWPEWLAKAMAERPVKQREEGFSGETADPPRGDAPTSPRGGGRRTEGFGG